MKKKLVKLTILTMLCIGGLCLLTGCGGKQTTTTSKSDSAEKESKDENTSLPADFAQALTDEDYEAILEMLYLPENSIVSAENIQAFLQRSNLQDFLGTDEITAEVTDETDTQIIGNLSIGEGKNGNCTVIFNRNKENEYVLDMEAAYQEREIKAPGEASIRINGIKLNEDWASYDIALRFLSSSIANTDHIIAYDIESNHDDISNYLSMHSACNSQKGNKPFLQWLNEDKSNRLKYLQDYFEKVNDSIKTKKISKKKYKHYVAYATQTIFEASKGQVKLPETEIDPKLYLPNHNEFA